jgi:hypothetical protein
MNTTNYPLNLPMAAGKHNWMIYKILSSLLGSQNLFGHVYPLDPSTSTLKETLKSLPAIGTKPTLTSIRLNLFLIPTLNSLAPTNQSQFTGVTLNVLGNILTIILSLLNQHLLNLPQPLHVTPQHLFMTLMLKKSLPFLNQLLPPSHEPLLLLL